MTYLFIAGLVVLAITLLLYFSFRNSNEEIALAIGMLCYYGFRIAPALIMVSVIWWAIEHLSISFIR